MSTHQMDTHRRLPACVSICLFCLLLASACTPSAGTALPLPPFPTPTASAPGTPSVSLPPAPSATPLPPVSSATPLPSPTPSGPCLADLKYLSDLTIPDFSVVAPGASLDKRWLVLNSGTCDWDAGYHLRMVSGADLGLVDQLLYPARAGTQATLQVLLTAPSQPGTVTNTWQAFDPNGQPFGEVITITIIVQQP